MSSMAFTEEQQRYLEGFASGSGLARSLPLAVLPAGGATFAATLGMGPDVKPKVVEIGVGPDSLMRAAQDRTIADGKKLCPEEQAKRKLNGLDTWDMVMEHAKEGRFPRGTDVLMLKYQGMFYVAPAQDAFMCRLRFPAGIVNTFQMRGMADLAEKFGGGYTDVTTRANLQIRQIGPKHTPDVLIGLADLGVIIRGSGADNIRNVTASPTAGIDPHELIDTRPLAKAMHHYILNHREMYGLPRKFNIAFDGGGTIAALEDTNDIGFVAVRISEANASIPELPAGIYFRMQLGGITGHKDFARDTGTLLTEAECVPAAAAVVRAFIEHGDRTDRTKARLKYVLDRLGFEKFMEETEKQLGGKKFRRFPLEKCEKPMTLDRVGHIGFHPQKQEGLSYVGVVLPVGRMTVDQMRGLAAISDKYGTGDIRLTVWQNLLITNVPLEKQADVALEIQALGLDVAAKGVRGGLVACTGNAGCKFASANTKAHAMQIANWVDSRLDLDQPINLHVTGCHNSCAQHFIGDIGLIATKVEVSEDEVVEGYHIFVGGGYGPAQDIGRELFKNVQASDCPKTVERMLIAYREHRQTDSENFQTFIRRFPTEKLQEMFAEKAVTA